MWVLYSLTAVRKKDLWQHSVLHCGFNSLPLKELSKGVRGVVHNGYKLGWNPPFTHLLYGTSHDRARPLYHSFNRFPIPLCAATSPVENCVIIQVRIKNPYRTLLIKWLIKVRKLCKTLPKMSTHIREKQLIPVVLKLIISHLSEQLTFDEFIWVLKQSNYETKG